MWNVWLQDVVKYGEIFLALNYLPKAGRLSVDVVKCKDLFRKESSRKVGTRFQFYNYTSESSRLSTQFK